MKGNEELDISPLLMIDRAHEARYGTIKLLEGLFSNFALIFPHLPRDTKFMGRLYLQRLVIELACQYVEDVGSYSVACLETGFLYAQRVISVTSREIWSFYSKVDKLADEDIRKIFNIPLNSEGAPIFDFSGIKGKYRNLREFRNKYQGLYNAMKHGSRVLHKEISTKDKPMNSMVGTYVVYQWFEVKQGQPQKLGVRTRDGSGAESEIRDSRMKTEIVPSDTVSEFVNVAEDCHQVIAQILQNNAPPARDKETII